ncbi:MAG TPA: hypothetical protein VIY53_07550 [Acidobacteriaceae bacterium]
MLATIRITTAVAFVFGALVAPAQTAPTRGAATKPFTDSQYGVSFQYPANWTLTTEQHFYIPESILTLPQPQSDGHATARAAVFLDGKAWPALDNSELKGADFVYNTRPGPNMKDCTAWLHRQVNFDKSDEQTQGGIAFTHVLTGSAGLCHQIDESIYIHQASRTCFFFDLAVHTICPGVAEGERNATPEQLDGVRAELGKIFETVRISP